MDEQPSTFRYFSEEFPLLVSFSSDEQPVRIRESGAVPAI